jgi:hypothetical protein
MPSLEFLIPPYGVNRNSFSVQIEVLDLKHLGKTISNLISLLLIESSSKKKSQTLIQT